MADYAPQFAVYDESLQTLFGTSPNLELLHENKEYPFAHEAGVFIQENEPLFITSNQFQDAVTNEKRIQITRVALAPDGRPIECDEVEASQAPMANGGINYKGGVLFCAPGDNHSPGGLVFMKSVPPYNSETLLSSFYGREFNCVNDVVAHSDSSGWFTDPIYGYEREFKPKPRLPCQVYRYDPQRRSVRVVADGFGRPNGICISPDEKIVYITDTDWIHGDGTTDEFRATHM